MHMCVCFEIKMAMILLASGLCGLQPVCVYVCVCWWEGGGGRWRNYTGINITFSLPPGCRETVEQTSRQQPLVQQAEGRIHCECTSSLL